MPISTILFGLALMALMITIVASPLRHAAWPAAKEANPPINDSPASHSQVLLALRDLEFDHRTGKIASEDYSGLRATLLAEAATAIEHEEATEARLSSEIEEAVRALRTTQPKAPHCSQCGAALEPTDRFCSTCGRSTMRRCPNCGAEAFPADRICSGCSTALPTITGLANR